MKIYEVKFWLPFIGNSVIKTTSHSEARKAVKEFYAKYGRNYKGVGAYINIITLKAQSND